MILGIDADQFEVPHRALLVAIVTGHSNAFEQTARRSTATSTPGMPVNLLDTVGGSLASEVVTLHHAGETTTFGGSGHIDLFDFVELLDGDFVADTKFGVATEFFDEPLRLAIGLGNRFDAGIGSLFGSFGIELGDMASLGSRGEFSSFVFKAELDGGVAVSLLCSNLQNVTGPGLDNGHWNGGAVFQVDLRHPDFAAEY